jgi:hypothetical protein
MNPKQENTAKKTPKKIWTKPQITAELSIEKTLGTLNNNNADMGVKSYS